ncbi:hypothetical protein ACFE04_017315 [Oxalis oulophora]
MASRKELGLPVITPKEKLARAALNRVWAAGHTYVELRQNCKGKQPIFFCTLCLTPCYSEPVLHDHLVGKLHNGRLPAAKVTLMKSNPWPYNDGIFFFNNAIEDERQPAKTAFVESSVDDNNLAIVEYTGNPDNQNGKGEGSNGNGDKGDYDVVIPAVRIKDKICYLKVRFTGLGQVASSLIEKADGSSEISKIWCEWLGKKALSSEDKGQVPDHEFSIVNFANTYDLGRKDLFENVRLLLAFHAESEDGEGSSGKRKKKKQKSFSEPEDVGSSVHQYDDLLLNTRSISSKSLRREANRQQRVAEDRTCYICQHKLLLGKDVATLVNTKTGKLACSSRNVNGAFHIFHISCLIRWILLCESEIIANQSSDSKGRRSSKRKNLSKDSDGKRKISFVFCPECQGTGVNLEGDILKMEKPQFSLSQMYQCMMKLGGGRSAWMKSPEVLENCSMGLHFPSESGETEQTVQQKLKMLRFYHAEHEQAGKRHRANTHLIGSAAHLNLIISGPESHAPESLITPWSTSSNNGLMKEKKIQKSDLESCINMLRKFRRYRHALQLSDWMSDESKHPLTFATIAIRLDLIPKSVTLKKQSSILKVSLKVQGIFGCIILC